MVVAPGGIVHVGIDAAREQLVEFAVEGGPAQQLVAHVVPREGGQVAEIEDERMAQGDRLGQPGARREDLEDAVRPGPRLGQPVRHRLDHGVPPSG